MSQATTPADPLRQAATNPRTWLWITLIVSSILRVVAIAHSFFWADDFVHIWRAWREEVLEFTLRPYNGHFEPLGMLVFWLMTRAAPQAWGPAMVYLCVLAIALPIAFWSVARKLMGSGWRTTATVVVFCAWPATLMAQTWFAAGVQATAFLVVLIALRVYLGSPRMRLPILVVLLIVGALFYQRALALPLLLMAVAVLRADGPPIRRLLGVLRRDAALWITLWGVALAGLAVGIVVGSSSANAGDDVTAANTAQGAWYGLVPGLLQSLAGMMWAWGEERTTLPEPMPIGLLVLLLVAVGFLVAVGWARDRAQTICALVSVGLMLAVEIAPVILVRTGFLGPSITTDPRLNTMSGILAILAVSSFFWNKDTAAQTSAGTTDDVGSEQHQPPARRALVPVLIGVIVLGGLISMGSYIDNMDGRRSSTWFAQVRSTIASQPPETVYASVASPPYMIDPSWTLEGDNGYRQSVGTIQTLLDVGPEAPRMNAPTDRAATFNGFGDLGKASVDTRSVTTASTEGRCPFAAVNGRAVIAMPSVELENPVLEFEYDASAPTPARVGFGGADEVDIQLRQGRHTYSVFPSAGPFSGFTLETADPSLTVCVRTAAAGVPFAD